MDRQKHEQRAGRHSGPNYTGRRLGAVVLTAASLVTAAEGRQVLHDHGGLPGNVQVVDNPHSGHEGAGKATERKMVTYVVRQDDNPSTIGSHFGKNEQAAMEIESEIKSEEAVANILPVGQQVTFDAALTKYPHSSRFEAPDSGAAH